MAAATRIGRLHLHGGADPIQARLRLASLLARAELRPPGLPPAAVLCVRHVSDPLPGALRLETAEARPPPDWERAVVVALERALQGAARPAHGPVPAGAEAVLFADRAELLACLARDARDGTAWLHWWWRDLSVLRSGGGDPVAAVWLETPEYVPAALELLAAAGVAAPFVASLSARDAAALVLDVAATHGLPELRRAVAAPVAAPSPARRRAGAVGDRRRPEPPWRRLVPESSAPLTPRAELLLGTALVLRRAPWVARSRAFAAAARSWLAAAQAPSPDAPTTAAPPPIDPPPRVPAATAPPAEPSPQAHGRRRRVARGATLSPVPAARPPAAAPGRPGSPAPSPAAETAHPAPSIAAVPPPPTLPVAQPADPPAETRPVPPPAPEASAAPPVARPRAATPAAPSHPPARLARTGTAPPPARAVSPEPAADPRLAAETGLGGVFYLLNLALFLELYGDFTRPLERGLALDPWDLLALLAPQLLADPSRDDPLWPLLARLAGRGPRERPGHGFRAPRAWRTPLAWLEPFDHDGAWRWSAARGTLRLVHPAGFPVAAVPRTPEPPAAQLARELRRLRPVEPAPRRTSLPREPARPLSRWTGRLAAYADARLRHALGLGPGDALDAVLLRRPARVFVTPSHVDVELRLAELPLEVRFVGLDRTPGWIPAAGRLVSFHFA